MRDKRFEAEMMCHDCGYVFTAQFISDGDSGDVSLEYSQDECCAECGSAHVEQVE